MMGREEKLVGWFPPLVHWLKLNTDGAFKASIGMASAGGIIRDKNGDWITGFAMHIGPSSPLQAELWAVLQGLTLCLHRGFNRIIVEVDSKCVVDILQRRDKRVGPNYRLTRDINKLLNKEWKIKIAHNYRERNRCADAIANHVFSLPQGLHILEDLPDEVKKILLQDIVGVSFPKSCMM